MFQSSRQPLSYAMLAWSASTTIAGEHKALIAKWKSGETVSIYPWSFVWACFCRHFLGCCTPSINEKHFYIHMIWGTPCRTYRLGSTLKYQHVKYCILITGESCWHCDRARHLFDVQRLFLWAVQVPIAWNRGNYNPTDLGRVAARFYARALASWKNI